MTNDYTKHTILAATFLADPTLGWFPVEKGGQPVYTLGVNQGKPGNRRNRFTQCVNRSRPAARVLGITLVYTPVYTQYFYKTPLYTQVYTLGNLRFQRLYPGCKPEYLTKCLVIASPEPLFRFPCLTFPLATKSNSLIPSFTKPFPINTFASGPFGEMAKS